jgi:anaerobic magnesium-protoporphyrin IX monomethyl ester cyclase
MGEYLPPPYGLIQLAAYIEREAPSVDIEIIDCNAEGIERKGLEKRLDALNPDIVGISSVATCNAYVTLRAAQAAKKACPETITVTGGQHFTALAQESLEKYPVLDVVIRDEGEKTLVELIKNNGKANEGIQGLSYRNGENIINTSSRPLIQDIHDLPYPGYHFVEDHLQNYHFTAMGGRDTPYALIEGGRGCPHKCTFCTQWSHWGGTCRTKTPERIADEIAYCYNEYGSRFIWLTDDNFGVETKIIYLGYIKRVLNGL